MRRNSVILCLYVLGLAGLASLVYPSISHAQSNTTGSICVLAYLDENGNNSRDLLETGQPDININLHITDGIIIANYVTMDATPHCFEQVPSSVDYTVSINSPFFETRTPDGAMTTLTIKPNETVVREFAMQRKAVQRDATQPLIVPLTISNRLALSAVCALASMSALGAIGLLIYGLRFVPRKIRVAAADFDDN